MEEAETAALAELQSLQLRVLRRIQHLELSLLPHSATLSSRESDLCADSDCATADRLSSILRGNGVGDFAFKRVPSDYYDHPLEFRRESLGAASVRHLCKSIVLVNTQAQSCVTDCSDRNNSKYYVVVVQYMARFNAEMVKSYLYTLNGGKIAKKKFNPKNLSEISKLKAQLSAEFEMKDLGVARKILGMEISRDREGGTLCLSHRSYIEKVLKRFGMDNAKAVKTPLAAHFMLSERLSPQTDNECALHLKSYHTI